MKNKRKFNPFFALFLLVHSVIVGQVADIQHVKPIYPNAQPVCDCAALMKATIQNTTIVSASVNTKDSSCLVTAIVNHPPANDSVKVWIALPIFNWNGRFEGTGGGGFVGGHMEALALPLSQGFAVGATNTGHDGGSGSFALNSKGQLDWQLIRDNTYLGIHDMTVVGKELVKIFYGKAAKYSYFVGGSTGGRQGLSEAQRFPKDYDGILSFYPAINWHKFVFAELWAQVVMRERNNYISAQKFEAVNKAVIADVDSKDGFTDGVIENALTLKYDPSLFIGKTMGDSEFTAKDAEVIQKIWEGPRTKDGQFMWYGILPGTDFTALAGTQGTPLTGRPFPVSVGWTKYFLNSNPQWDGTNLSQAEFELLFNQSAEQYGSVFGTDNPDLTAFKNNGGKLVIIHGLTDRLICAQGTIQYYQRVQEKMGGAAKTLDFAHLYLIPGLDHSYNNPPLKPINHLDALMEWVEKKKAPKKILVEHKDKTGKVTRSASYSYFLNKN